MEILSAALKVIAAGLVFGAGLPALFAVGIRLRAEGQQTVNADGSVAPGKPVASAAGVALFALVALTILVGILWIMRASLDHYLGVSLFGGA